MAIEAAVLVRAGGSALIAVAGVVALALARRDKGALALGAMLVAWGVRLAGNNLFAGDAAAGVYWVPIVLVLLAVQTAAFVVLALHWPRAVRREDRPALLAAAGTAATVLVVRLADLAWDLSAHGTATLVDRQLVPTTSLALALGEDLLDSAKNAAEVAFAVLLPLRYLRTPRDDAPARRQLAWASVLLVTPFGAGNNLVLDGRFIAWPVFADAEEFFAYALAAALWIVAARHADGRPARRTAHGILGLMLAGAAAGAWTDPSTQDALHGVQRSVVAFLLVWGMMRLGFLGREVQFRTARRGTLAAGALALVLITAQVAQNFLAAQYGLLMGGVVAGAFLFAAQPLQRAFEGRPVAPAVAARPDADGAREAAYRAAVRRYLRDGRLTRDEERELAHLAGELGLHAGRAMEIRHAVEDEAATRGWPERRT